jgi:hypothetical protein
MIEFAEVGRMLRGLPEDWESEVHARFRQMCGSVSKWSAGDRAKMAGAITWLEDYLELENDEYDRSELQRVRRMLEDSAEAYTGPCYVRGWERARVDAGVSLREARASRRLSGCKAR